MAAAAANVDEGNVPPDEAALLVQRGLREIYEPAPDQFSNLDMAKVRPAATTGLNRAQLMQRIRVAEAELARAAGDLDADWVAIASRIVDMAIARYRTVPSAAGPDGAAYREALGFALAARAALETDDRLRRENLLALSAAQGAFNRFIGLWEGPNPVDAPACQTIAEQAIRVQQALTHLR